MKKRILIHSLVYTPDGVSTAYLYKDIALSLKQNGMDVIVLTTTPHYNKVESQIEKQPLRWKIRGFLKESEHDGIKVLHVPQQKFKSTLLRLLGFIYWHLVSFVTVLFLKKVDIILSPSPPLTIGLINIWLGRIKGAKVIYNVQEVYPDILGKKSGVVDNMLSRMERYVYDKSSAVTTIDTIFYNTISVRFKQPEKLRIIPNFVDTEIYKPLDRVPNLDKSLFKENNNLKLLYAGNIGMAQDWETLVELAGITKEKSFEFYVIGEGMMLDYLKDKISENKLSNIHVIPYQPRELMPDIIAFSDIQFIFMKPEIAAQGFPSKVYTIMASSKPLLVCSPPHTPIVSFLSDIGCAHIITETDVSAKARNAELWLSSISRNELTEMGKRGYNEISKKYSKEIVTQQYFDLINNL